MSATLQDRIRERAYQLWEEDGRPSGRDAVHWALAEAALRVAAPAAPVALTPPASVQPPRNPAERAILATLLACFVLALAGIAAYATVSRLAAKDALELERDKAAGQLALEQRRLQADLLVEAARAGDPQTVARNLQFLIAAGLVDDRDRRIAAMVEAGKLPVFAASAAADESSVNTRRIVENGSDFLVASRAQPAGDRTMFTYRVTNNGPRDETVDWGDILHATIAPGRTSTIVRSAPGAARSVATFFQWSPTARTLVYAFVPDPGGGSPPAPAAP